MSHTVQTFPAYERLIAVLPEVVDRAMRRALPDEYTPEVAAQIAAGTIAHLRAVYAAAVTL